MLRFVATGGALTSRGGWSGMDKNITPLRPGLTAIAAVLAFSSTAALAQTTDMSAAPPATIMPHAPVAASPAPAPSVTPSPITPAWMPTLNVAPSTTNVTPSPILAEPASASAASNEAPAPMATASHPVMHIPAASDDSASTSSKPKLVKAKAVKTADSASPKAADATPEVTPASRTPAGETATASPTVASDPAPAPVAQMAPAPSAAAPAPAATASTNSQDETLEIAGVGGVAVLLLAGGAFALYRRNRRADEDDAHEMAPVMVENEPVVMPATATVAAPVGVPHQTDGALPDGFDLSRFGPRVQAAYRGPTADNPSLSLKTRLKRARFFDMRERRKAEAGRTPTAPAAVAPTRDPETVSARSDEQIVYRPDRVTEGGFRPGFHRFSS